MQINSVSFNVRGRKRVGVRLSPDRTKGRKPAVLMLHGFPGAEKNLDIARELSARGWVCLMPHFCGSWGSHGFYSFSGILKDTRDFWDVLARDPEVNPRKMALLGFSMGGWAALNFAASRAPLKAVVALAPMAGSRMWFDAASRQTVWNLASTLEIESQRAIWRDFKTTLLKNDPLETIHRIAPRPLLIVHGTQDELVPYALGRELYRRAGEPKKFVTVRGSDHGFTEHRSYLVKIVSRWLLERVR